MGPELWHDAVASIKPNQSKLMKTKAIFYHAGCPVCVAAETHVAAALDPARYDVEVVHLGQTKSRLSEAERAGVKSVPALVLAGAAYHINFGAGIEALR
jgi:glutaredoxin